MVIAGVEFGYDQYGYHYPCRVIAEMSNSHGGDFERLCRLIDAAVTAGADLVKFQCYTPTELVELRGNGPAPEPWGSSGYTMRELYQKAQTPLAWFPEIASYCKRRKIPWFSSFFGSESLKCLESVGCPAYKISHFECDNKGLVWMAEATEKPVLISYQNRPRWDNEFFRIWCPGGYPAEMSDFCLRSATHLRDFDGLSSHCLHPLVAPVAVACGIKYLEYHFHLEAEPSELEANVSLNEREFAAMVQSVRDAEVLLG